MIIEGMTEINISFSLLFFLLSNLSLLTLLLSYFLSFYVSVSIQLYGDHSSFKYKWSFETYYTSTVLLKKLKPLLQVKKKAIVKTSKENSYERLTITRYTKYHKY